MVFQHLPTTWDVFLTCRKSMGLPTNLNWWVRLPGGTTWVGKHRHGAAFGGGGWGWRIFGGCWCRGCYVLHGEGRKKSWCFHGGEVGVDDGGCCCWWLLELSWSKLPNWIEWYFFRAIAWTSSNAKICAPKILQKAWDMDFVDCIMVPDGEVRFETSKISVEFGWWCSVSHHPRFRWFAVQEEGNKKRH